MAGLENKEFNEKVSDRLSLSDDINTPKESSVVKDQDNKIDQLEYLSNNENIINSFGSKPIDAKDNYQFSDVLDREEVDKTRSVLTGSETENTFEYDFIKMIRSCFPFQSKFIMEIVGSFLTLKFLNYTIHIQIDSRNSSLPLLREKLFKNAIALMKTLLNSYRKDISEEKQKKLNSYDIMEQNALKNSKNAALVTSSNNYYRDRGNNPRSNDFSEKKLEKLHENIQGNEEHAAEFPSKYSGLRETILPSIIKENTQLDQSSQYSKKDHKFHSGFEDINLNYLDATKALESTFLYDTEKSYSKASISKKYLESSAKSCEILGLNDTSTSNNFFKYRDLNSDLPKDKTIEPYPKQSKKCAEILPSSFTDKLAYSTIKDRDIEANTFLHQQHKETTEVMARGFKNEISSTNETIKPCKYISVESDLSYSMLSEKLEEKLSYRPDFEAPNNDLHIIYSDINKHKKNNDKTLVNNTSDSLNFEDIAETKDIDYSTVEMEFNDIYVNSQLEDKSIENIVDVIHIDTKIDSTDYYKNKRLCITGNDSRINSSFFQSDCRTISKHEDFTSQLEQACENSTSHPNVFNSKTGSNKNLTDAIFTETRQDNISDMIDYHNNSVSQNEIQFNCTDVHDKRDESEKSKEIIRGTKPIDEYNYDKNHISTINNCLGDHFNNGLTDLDNIINDEKVQSVFVTNQSIKESKILLNNNLVSNNGPTLTENTKTSSTATIMKSEKYATPDNNQKTKSCDRNYATADIITFSPAQNFNRPVPQSDYLYNFDLSDLSIKHSENASKIFNFVDLVDSENMLRSSFVVDLDSKITKVDRSLEISMHRNQPYTHGRNDQIDNKNSDTEHSSNNKAVTSKKEISASKIENMTNTVPLCNRSATHFSDDSLDKVTRAFQSCKSNLITNGNSTEEFDINIMTLDMKQANIDAIMKDTKFRKFLLSRDDKESIKEQNGTSNQYQSGCSKSIINEAPSPKKMKQSDIATYLKKALQDDKTSNTSRDTNDKLSYKAVSEERPSTPVFIEQDLDNLTHLSIALSDEQSQQADHNACSNSDIILDERRSFDVDSFSTSVIFENEVTTSVRTSLPPTENDRNLPNKECTTDVSYLNRTILSLHDKPDGYIKIIKLICSNFKLDCPEYEIVRENDVYTCTATFLDLNFVSSFSYDKTTSKNEAAKKAVAYLTEHFESIIPLEK